jgi:abhydrolase domain-containing protein 1/3
VFNFRGRGGHTLVTPRTYCATKCDDLHAVIQHVRASFPKSKVMAVGVSLGGIVLGNYLTQRQEKAREDLAAAFLVSVCYDCFKGTESLEKNGLNLLLNRHLANCLVRSIKEARTSFETGISVPRM